jgi:anti-sigma B factor antagonist
MHRVDVERDGGVAAVVAGGEIDQYGAPELSDALSSVARERRVLVDLTAVTFLDSTALGVVVRAVRELAAHGGDARVVLPKGSARRIFELTTLDQVLPLEESRAQALAALTETRRGS